jgi:hypothetical protein
MYMYMYMWQVMLNQSSKAFKIILMEKVFNEFMYYKYKKIS